MLFSTSLSSRFIYLPDAQYHDQATMKGLEHLQQCSICDPLNIFFQHPSSVYVLFCNPTHTTETRRANRWGRLIIANHLDQSLWWTNQKHWAPVRSNLLHSFWCRCTAPFTSHGKLHKYAEPKPISWAKPACGRFSSSIFCRRCSLVLIQYQDQPGIWKYSIVVPNWYVRKDIISVQTLVIFSSCRNLAIIW